MIFLLSSLLIHASVWTRGWTAHAIACSPPGLILRVALPFMALARDVQITISSRFSLYKYTRECNDRSSRRVICMDFCRTKLSQRKSLRLSTKLSGMLRLICSALYTGPHIIILAIRDRALTLALSLHARYRVSAQDYLRAIRHAVFIFIFIIHVNVSVILGYKKIRLYVWNAFVGTASQ